MWARKASTSLPRRVAAVTTLLAALSVPAAASSTLRMLLPTSAVLRAA